MYCIIAAVRWLTVYPATTAGAILQDPQQTAAKSTTKYAVKICNHPLLPIHKGLVTLYMCQGAEEPAASSAASSLVPPLGSCQADAVASICSPVVHNPSPWGSAALPAEAAAYIAV